MKSISFYSILALSLMMTSFAFAQGRETDGTRGGGGDGYVNEGQEFECSSGSSKIKLVCNISGGCSGSDQRDICSKLGIDP